MKLFYSPTSPYVRKVMMVAYETGQAEELELTPLTLSPINPVESLNRSNPLGKVPALVLDDGTVLYDSRSIVAYLDDRHTGRKLIPESGAEKWAVHRCQALADGILDAGILARYESFLRPKELYWEEWYQAQSEKMSRGLAAMANEIDSLGDDVSLSHIAFGAALGYMAFRYPDFGWREKHPALADWFDSFSERDSMQKTVPQG